MKPQAIYVEFSPHYLGPGKLTKAWHVVGRGSRTTLGEIKWHAHWRRYTFHPAITHQCIFDARCMEVIIAFLDEQTELQRAAAAKRREESKAVDRVLSAMRHQIQFSESFGKLPQGYTLLVPLYLYATADDIAAAEAAGVILRHDIDMPPAPGGWELTAAGKQMMGETAA